MLSRTGEVQLLTREVSDRLYIIGCSRAATTAAGDIPVLATATYAVYHVSVSLPPLFDNAIHHGSRINTARITVDNTPHRFPGFESNTFVSGLRSI